VPLKPQHLDFINAYLTNGSNATQAAISALYSAKTAGQIAHKLLKRADIQAELLSRQAKLEKKTDTLRDKIMAEFGRIGFSDIRQLYDDKGLLIPINKLPADVAAAIQSVDGKKIKLASKLEALNSMAKTIGMFQEQVNQTAVQVIIMPPAPDGLMPASEIKQLKPNWG
jgi:hypothetical protein